MPIKRTRNNRLRRIAKRSKKQQRLQRAGGPLIDKAIGAFVLFGYASVVGIQGSFSILFWLISTVFNWVIVPTLWSLLLGPTSIAIITALGFVLYIIPHSKKDYLMGLLKDTALLYKKKMMESAAERVASARAIKLADITASIPGVALAAVEFMKTVAGKIPDVLETTGATAIGAVTTSRQIIQGRRGLFNTARNAVSGIGSSLYGLGSSLFTKKNGVGGKRSAASLERRRQAKFNKQAVHQLALSNPKIKAYLDGERDKLTQLKDQLEEDVTAVTKLDESTDPEVMEDVLEEAAASLAQVEEVTDKAETVGGKNSDPSQPTLVGLKNDVQRLMEEVGTDESTGINYLVLAITGIMYELKSHFKELETIIRTGFESKMSEAPASSNATD